MQLTIVTQRGLPAFRVEVAPSDSIGKLTKTVGRKACIVGHKGLHFHNNTVLRLSIGKAWLKASDTVEELGIQNGAVVMMHVRNTPLISTSERGGFMPNKLPVHSFAATGYGFFVNVVTPTGRLIWRPKLFPNDDASKIVGEARTKTKCKTATLKYRRHSGETVRLDKGSKIVDLGMGQNDELVVHGLPDEQPHSSPRPAKPFASDSVNALARPGSAPPSRGRTWVPTGAANWP